MENKVSFEKQESENNLKLSIPSEKVLKKEKRNKRKSKVYELRKTSDISLPNVDNKADEVVNEMEHRGNIFKESDLTAMYTNGGKFMSTLENFDSLSFSDSEKEKENINNNCLEFMIGISEEYKAEYQPFRSNVHKTSHSQRFRDSTGAMDSVANKRFKI